MKKLFIIALILVSVLSVQAQSEEIMEKRAEAAKTMNEAMKEYETLFDVNVYFNDEHHDMVFVIQYNVDIDVESSSAKDFFVSMHDELSYSDRQKLADNLEFTYMKVKVKNKWGTVKSTYRKKFVDNIY